jgi:hypothetical protein
MNGKMAEKELIYVIQTHWPAQTAQFMEQFNNFMLETKIN